jgi:ketosteroid isomerase-like protein
MSQANVEVVGQALGAYSRRDVAALRALARFIEAGESVVVPNVAHQRGRDGIEVSARSTLVFTLRRGRIAHICLYQETGEALDAVGLAR